MNAPLTQFSSTRRLCLQLAACSLLLTGIGFSPVACAIDANEDHLIQQLIGEVEALHQGTFIRNGLSYDAEKAASHLRDKLAYFKNDIHTADDFIRLCATRSEMTGIRYKLKDGSGVSVDAAEWLYTKLSKMRSAQQGGTEHSTEASASK